MFCCVVWVEWRKNDLVREWGGGGGGGGGGVQNLSERINLAIRHPTFGPVPNDNNIYLLNSH